jgi:hypothetical protein
MARKVFKRRASAIIFLSSANAAELFLKIISTIVSGRNEIEKSFNKQQEKHRA